MIFLDKNSYFYSLALIITDLLVSDSVLKEHFNVNSDEYLAIYNKIAIEVRKHINVDSSRLYLKLKKVKQKMKDMKEYLILYIRG